MARDGGEATASDELPSSERNVSCGWEPSSVWQPARMGQLRQARQPAAVAGLGSDKLVRRLSQRRKKNVNGELIYILKKINSKNENKVIN